MTTLGYADLPVPAGGESPTVPAHLAALAEAIDPHLRHTAEDLADRTTKYATAPAHTLVTATDGTMWLKTSGPDTDVWVTIWEPPPVWDLTLTLAAGLQEGDVDIALMKVDGGRRVELKGRIERTDGLKINDANAVNLGTVPDSCVPSEIRTWVGACSMAGTTTDAAGRLEVLPIGTGSAYGDAGDVLWWYQGTDGTDWVDLSGYYVLV